ncbi:hypothetical protein PR202_gb02623 [Eleusine coracana subsp. coracana]|uniref:BTB domain-containing protein n=1 Tax=Eleusine coracana subsp. coracana TaxID=191504 RepID=A0AAV5DZS1_ELECO|nr:hypothetical protein PR202_gb02623 [Eleusine coracana subsp. coracana]
MLDSGFLEFKLNYSKTKDLAIGDAIYSQHIFAGGHIWRIKCYPRGDKKEGASISPADVASHLGGLLRGGEGSDVSFSVGGETFPAHRAVLAARSPVFKAELMGSMAEATMATITLQDIEPETFRDMLHFMYTDTLPDLEKDYYCSPSTIEFERFQALLVAANRYALDMLKLVCAQKLSDVMSVDNATTILHCAELHGCPELKSKCLDFFTEANNSKKLVLSEG